MLRNIIFDFGGVLIRLDFNRVIKAFEQIGGKDFSRYYTQVSQAPFFDEFDKGLISPEAFRKQFNLALNLNLSPSQFDTAWNAMLLDIPKENIDFLVALKKRYNIFLLSNTNKIHIDAIKNYLLKTYSITDWKNYFNKVYYSFEAGMRKPDKEIFERVLSENNLIASETLFVEDSEKHLEAARQLGIQIFPFPTNASLPTELKFLLQ